MNSMITVLLVLVLSLALGGVVSVVASAGEYGSGAVDQLSRCGAVGPHIDGVEADKESDANYNWHFVMQITTSTKTLEFFS